MFENENNCLLERNNLLKNSSCKSCDLFPSSVFVHPFYHLRQHPCIQIINLMRLCLSIPWVSDLSDCFTLCAKLLNPNHSSFNSLAWMCLCQQLMRGLLMYVPLRTVETSINSAFSHLSHQCGQFPLFHILDAHCLIGFSTFRRILKGLEILWHITVFLSAVQIINWIESCKEIWGGGRRSR